MTDRCKPPSEMIYMNKWHWVQPLNKSELPWMLRWEPVYQEWRDDDNENFRMSSDYYGYLGPVTPYVEVEALRADRDAALKAASIARVDARLMQMAVAENHKMQVTGLQTESKELRAALKAATGEAGAVRLSANEVRTIAQAWARDTIERDALQADNTHLRVEIKRLQDVAFEEAKCLVHLHDELIGRINGTAAEKAFPVLQRAVQRLLAPKT